MQDFRDEAYIKGEADVDKYIEQEKARERERKQKAFECKFF